MNKPVSYIILLSLIFLAACTGKNITGRFYTERKQELDSIKNMYGALYAQRPFSMAFTDKRFHNISLDIHTDSLTYIYDFQVIDPRLRDTLRYYDFDLAGTMQLIRLMQTIKSTWVNRFDYYSNGKKEHMIMISVKPRAFKPIFGSRKYYILTYYAQPQLYDENGKLLDRRRSRRLRKINGISFQRINDSICYGVSAQFR